MLTLPKITEHTSILELIQNGSLMIINGGIHMTNNIAKGISNSIVSFGEGANNTVINNNNNGVSEDLLMKLFKEIDASELKGEDREELKELLEEAQAASSAENPKKSVIKRMLEASKGIIDSVNSSPALIETYTKWAQFIQNPPVL